jgi:hypothetical protein
MKWAEIDATSILVSIRCISARSTRFCLPTLRAQA